MSVAASVLLLWAVSSDDPANTTASQPALRMEFHTAEQCAKAASEIADRMLAEKHVEVVAKCVEPGEGQK
jgi:hypothetical protein